MFYLPYLLIYVRTYVKPFRLNIKIKQTVYSSHNEGQTYFTAVMQALKCSPFCDTTGIS